MLRKRSDSVRAEEGNDKSINARRVLLQTLGP